MNIPNFLIAHPEYQQWWDGLNPAEKAVGSVIDSIYNTNNGTKTTAQQNEQTPNLGKSA